MNRQRFGGREITVVVASETRKGPEDMRHRARPSGPSHRDGHRSAYGHSRSRSRSRSRSPYYRPTSRTRQISRSHSPPSRRQGDRSASPKRSDRTRPPRDYPEGRDEDHKQRSQSRSYTPPSRRHGDHSASPKRPSDRTRPPRDYPEGRDEDHKQRSQSPMYRGANNGHAKKELYDDDDDDDDERRRPYSRSPRRVSRSPPGSRSRSADSGRSR